MAYTELTVWTRGIIMDKEGRDIVNSVAAAGRLEGKFAQAMENYVDNPDRTNAPTRKYCRLSDSVIENALTYENEQPNIVVLVEQTMVKGWDYMRGMPPGGTLVINTHYTPEYMIRFVPGAERLAQLVCVDAAKIADHKWLYYRLGELGLDRLSTEGAAERNNAIAPDIAAPLIAAVVKTTGIVKLESIEPMIANKAAFAAALDQLHIMPWGGSLVSTDKDLIHVYKRDAHSTAAVPFAGITPASRKRSGSLSDGQLARHPVCTTRSCNSACATKAGPPLVKRAYRRHALIKEDMPFPSGSRRVCYHPCEQACNRGQADEAISIRAGGFSRDLAGAAARSAPPALTGRRWQSSGRARPGTAPRTSWRASATPSRFWRNRRKRAGSTATAFRTGCCRRTSSTARSSASSSSASRSRPTRRSARTSAGTT
jgi:hypothetical protein